MAQYIDKRRQTYTMNQQHMLEILQAGGLLLCVNQRLARYWQAHYDAWQQKQGYRAWLTPSIHALEHWVQQQYRIHAFSHAVLNSQQEKMLWQQIIDQNIGENLLDSRSMATRAQDAYALLHTYRLTLSDVPNESHEVQCFKEWATQFETRLNNMQLIVSPQVKQTLSTAIEQGHYPLAKQIIWAGFDDFNPINQHLFDSMQQHSDIHLQQPDETISHTEVWQCHDEDSELRRVCARIRQLYPHKQNIAVLVPDMQRRKQQIARLFHTELSPQSVLLKNDGDAAFNLSLGSPLIRQPMIRFIFLLLRCCHIQHIQFEHMSALLLSPYLFPEERISRANLETLLRKENMESFQLRDLLAWKRFSQYAPTTHATFHRCQTWHPPRQQLPSEWVDYLNQVLDFFQIQRTIQLSSEKAQWRNWLQMGDEVSALDDVLGSLPFLDFLRVMQQYCAEQAFRPDPSQSSIQVMGMLEASGMSFDHVFILGMHETAWPTQASPHPLLPLNLQREHQMPHADAQREFDYANQVWHNIMMSSEQIEISYPLISDGQDTRPSCLLQDMQTHVHQGNTTAQWQQQLFSTPAKMDTVQPNNLVPQSYEKIEGGSSLLHAQARCAFKAFAQFRLKVHPLAAKPHAGFNPLQRGNLLHEVLNQFWSETEHWDNLQYLSKQNKLKQTLQHCIDKTLNNQPLKTHPLHQEFEKNRLLHVLEQWLELELTRSPFIVLSREKSYDIHLPLPIDCQTTHMSLRVKIDRIDKDAKDNIILIDYKTGRVDIQGILKEPLLEPQLPLYLQVQDLQHANAVTFASIRADDKGAHFTGLSRDSDILPNVRPHEESWDKQLEQWKHHIQDLAADFFQGRTNAKPHHKTDCSYCQMQRLCRV